jgi:hypothetical protein
VAGNERNEPLHIIHSLSKIDITLENNRLPSQIALPITYEPISKTKGCQTSKE